MIRPKETSAPISPRRAPPHAPSRRAPTISAPPPTRYSQSLPSPRTYRPSPSLPILFLGALYVSVTNFLRLPFLLFLALCLCVLCVSVVDPSFFPLTHRH